MRFGQDLLKGRSRLFGWLGLALVGLILWLPSGVGSAEERKGPTVNFRPRGKESSASKTSYPAPSRDPYHSLPPAWESDWVGDLDASQSQPLLDEKVPVPVEKIELGSTESTGSHPGASSEAEQMVSVAVETPSGRAESGPQQTIWMDDDLPEGAEPEGTWVWDDQNKSSGRRSHGHPPLPGVQSHGWIGPKQKLPLLSQILQDVWLDPSNPPSGIAIRFQKADGEEIGVYWEGEEEVFTPGEYGELLYYGFLPELGRWTTLAIRAEDLGLEDMEIVGVHFLTYGGRALWDRTAIGEVTDSDEETPTRSSSSPAPTVPSNSAP